MRSLLQCYHAKGFRTEIYCKKGHKLGSTGTLEYERLERGDPLECIACQNCQDFDYLGKPIPAKYRGWIK